MVAALIILLMLLFLVIGMPIAFALGVSGSIGLIIVGGWDMFWGIINTSPIASVMSFVLTAIPMFILMAEFLTISGITKDLFQSAHKWFGHWPGGLGTATVFAGAGLGAICGSSTASSATLATAAVPEMRKYGYNLPFAMGIVSISGTLAIMIPPSLALIIYGITTETSIGKLFIAGIIPGILTAIGYIVLIYVWVKLKPETAPSVAPAKWRERFASLRLIWPTVLLIIIVIGLIYSGAVTPTEAGAAGAFSAFLIALFMKRLTFTKIRIALERTLKSTTMILTIVIGAMIFGYFMTITQVTAKILQFIGGLPVPSLIIIILIVIVYLILGMFLDQIAILILTLPFTFPIVTSLGFDAVWWGIIITKTIEIGLVSPPVGLNVFVSSGAAKVDTSIAFRGVVWFVVMDLFILAVLLSLPVISLWLPGLMSN